MQTELVAELRNASPVSVAADGTAVWSSYRPVDRTFRLLLRLPGRQPRVIAKARRGVAFDASAGRSNGGVVVVWSACRVAPRPGVTLGGLADYATGRSCRLRMFDVKRGTTRTLRTGDGSAFLPTVSSGGNVVYFRSHAGRTSIIRQSLSGKRRMSLTRVSGVPTSLAATSDHVAWTSGRVDRFGGIETSLRRRDIKRRQTAVIERRIVADGAGVQVAGVRIVGASIAYLRQMFGKDTAVPDQIVIRTLGGGGAREVNVPAGAVSIGIARSGATLVATGTQSRSRRGCVRRDARFPGCAIHRLVSR